jgi:predicted amidohydrolase
MKKIILLLILMNFGISVIAQSSIRIAGLQMDVSRNIAENEQTIKKYIHEAKERDVDFLITPEGSLSGYTSDFVGDELRNALHRIEETAKGAGIGLILGTCYKEEIGRKEYCFNQARVYLPDGTFLGTYSKILTCSPLDNPGTGEMMEYVQGRIKTFSIGEIDCGILICNDLWATPGFTTIPNPYLPWKMHEAGADIIFHLINSGTDLSYQSFHESSVELWAKALKIPIVEVNAAHGRKKINARSGVLDRKGERVVSVTSKGEQLFIYDLDL